MGIGPASELRYEAAVRKLFPKGAYWDGQLSDPESDASLFARAKAAELFRFRGRMADLYGESRIETALETLGGWERVLLGAPNPGLAAGERRAILAAAGAGWTGMGMIAEAGRLFGVEVTKVSLPFRPAFFGHARFGLDPIAGVSGFFAVLIHARAAGGRRREFEARVRATALVTNLAHFIYEEEEDGGNVS